jgi:hypothetical protein
LGPEILLVARNELSHGGAETIGAHAPPLSFALWLTRLTLLQTLEENIEEVRTTSGDSQGGPASGGGEVDGCANSRFFPRGVPGKEHPFSEVPFGVRRQLLATVDEQRTLTNVWKGAEATLNAWYIEACIQIGSIPEVFQQQVRTVAGRGYPVPSSV